MVVDGVDADPGAREDAAELTGVGAVGADHLVEVVVVERPQPAAPGQRGEFVVAVVLVVLGRLQPIQGGLVRCGPALRREPIVEWLHRATSGVG